VVASVAEAEYAATFGSELPGGGKTARKIFKNLKAGDRRESTKTKRTSGRRQDSKENFQKLEGRRPTGGKKAKKR
jgi:hypothetical protein